MQFWYSPAEPLAVLLTTLAVATGVSTDMLEACLLSPGALAILDGPATAVLALEMEEEDDEERERMAAELDEACD